MSGGTLQGIAQCGLSAQLKRFKQSAGERACPTVSRNACPEEMRPLQREPVVCMKNLFFGLGVNSQQRSDSFVLGDAEYVWKKKKGLQMNTFAKNKLEDEFLKKSTRVFEAPIQSSAEYKNTYAQRTLPKACRVLLFQFLGKTSCRKTLLMWKDLHLEQEVK